MNDHNKPDEHQFANHWVTLVLYAGIFVGFMLMIGTVSMYDTLFPADMRPTMLLVGIIVAATSALSLIAWFIVWSMRGRR